MVAILITAGPTREHLDDVRFLSNASSGRMGFALCEAAIALGHQPYLVLGPVEASPPAGAEVRRVVSAQEMHDAALQWFPRCEIAIAAAAVADWRPRQRQPGKPARAGMAEGAPTLELVPNPDIVAALAAQKGRRVVVGFSLESAAADPAQSAARGRDKLARKGLDLCVCNRADAIGQDESAVSLVFASGQQVDLPAQPKALTARAILQAALDLRQGAALAGGAPGAGGSGQGEQFQP